MQYKELQDIERCFRTLKSSLDIRPVYHFVDRRVRAHVFICVMALQIQRLMRQRLSLQRSVEGRGPGETHPGSCEAQP